MKPPIAFFNRNCKPLMRWYYKMFYKKEMIKVLKLFAEYKEIGIDITLATDILKLDTGWGIERTIKNLGRCIYCEYLKL